MDPESRTRGRLRTAWRPRSGSPGRGPRAYVRQRFEGLSGEVACPRPCQHPPGQPCVTWATTRQHPQATPLRSVGPPLRVVPSSGVRHGVTSDGPRREVEETTPPAREGYDVPCSENRRQVRNSDDGFPSDFARLQSERCSFSDSLGDVYRCEPTSGLSAMHWMPEVQCRGCDYHPPCRR